MTTMTLPFTLSSPQFHIQLLKIACCSPVPLLAVFTSTSRSLLHRLPLHSSRRPTYPANSIDTHIAISTTAASNELNPHVGVQPENDASAHQRSPCSLSTQQPTAASAASSTYAMAEKPAVLIVGGLGYIGRHLVKHIHDNDLASEIRIVDKQLPELAFLAPEFKEACTRERFVQADASREQFFPKIFDRPEGAKPFDYVFNCGGESRFAAEEDAYRMRSFLLSTNLGKEVAKRRIPAYVECSTGLVYESASTARKESDPVVKPASTAGKWRLQAATDLRNSASEGELNMVVLRLPNVYGPYCQGILSTVLCMARCFQDMESEMKWLWDESLRCHTIHVHDVARALWTAADWRAKANWKPEDQPVAKDAPPVFYPVFNVVDHNDTTQAHLATIVNKIFDIPTGFHSKLVSAFARMNLDSLVDNVNDETLDTWAQLQAQDGVKQGPIGPYIEVGVLKEQHLNLDGSLFEKTTGFKYEKEKLGEEEVRDIIESYKKMGWWP